MNIEEKANYALELATMKIKTIEEGKKFIEEISSNMVKLLEEMRESDLGNEKWQEYNDVRYSLKIAKQNIQSQMLRLARVK